MADAERVQQLLALAAEPPGPPLNPPGPDLLHRAVRRQRRRRALAVVGTFVVVLALVSPLALSHHGRPSPSARATPTAPAPVAAVPHVAAPSLVVAVGPVPRLQRPCRSSEVSGQVRLTASPYGVLGVATLSGAQCSFNIDIRTLTLLDAGGRSLGLAVRAEQVPNPAANIRPDLAEADGNVAVGFSWRGAWCGPAAARLRLTAVTAGYWTPTIGATVVEIPVVGPSPRCDSGARRSSYLVPGLVGWPNDAVLTPPPAWRALRASLGLPSGPVHTMVTTYLVRLHNSGSSPVTLTPCPNYAVRTSGNLGAGGTGSGGTFGSLPCGQVLAPGGTLVLSLPVDTQEVSYTSGPVQIAWAMAGVPTTAGTVRIR